MTRILLLIGLLIFGGGAIAQNLPKATLPPQIHLETPYHSIKNHLDYLQPSNYHPELAALSLMPDGYSKRELETLAIQLLQIYNGEGFFVKWSKVPVDSNYVDTTSLKHSWARYIVYSKYPEIYLEKKGGKWRYASQSLKAIPEIHAEIYPYGTAEIINDIPKSLREKFLGMYIWQYIALGALALIGWVLFTGLKFLFSLILSRLARKQLYWVKLEYIKPVTHPLSLYVVTSLLKIVIPLIQLPMLSGKIIMGALGVLAVIFAFITLFHLVDLVSQVARKLAQSTENNLDNQIIPLIAKVLKAMIIISGVIFVLRTLDVNITALVAGVSIGGLAFALAAQDTVKNFLGSVTILVDAPFQMGDHIEADGKSGVVEEVGLRSTRIRTSDNSLVSIPNAKLADSAVSNGGARKSRKFQPQLQIDAQTPLIQIQAFMKEIKTYLDDLQKPSEAAEDANKVYMTNLLGSSLEISITALFDSNTQNENEFKEKVLVAILQIANKHNIKFKTVD